MQAAIIPPIPHLSSTLNRRFHLVLSHLLENTEYSSFYQSLKRQNPEAFIILDNSAHETGSGEVISSVLARGRSISADEIVIPDHLFNREETVNRAKSSFEYLLSAGGSSLLLSYTPRLMLVAQGRSRRDYYHCLRDLSILARDFRKAFHERYFRLPDITFGVSKDYEIWDGNLTDLVGKNVIPVAASFSGQVHVLGWGHNLWGHRELGDRFGDQIRSTDSAKPWVYAANSVRLDSHYLDIPLYPKRRETYFDETLPDDQVSIAVHNVQEFDAACRGEILV